MSLYTWGLGRDGQLCNGKTDNLIVPHRVVKCVGGNKITTIAGLDCGAHFTAAICHDGSLYTSGCGKYGRLGQGTDEENCSVLTQVTGIPAVTQISCGFWHAVCVAESGEVYAWGYSKAVGSEPDKTGKTFNVGIPRRVLLGPDVRVCGISCGYNYTFAWCVQGRAYSWGRGQHGVLGQGSEEDKVKPSLVEGLKALTVVDVGAGHSHCGIVTSDGSLFMTGNGSCGALGLSNGGRCALAPTKVPFDDSDTKVTKVSCSKGEHHHHTLALLTGGTVMAWGDGYKGKLGLGHQDTAASSHPECDNGTANDELCALVPHIAQVEWESRKTPARIPPEHFNNERVTSVSAGGIHSAATTDQGSVLTWGCGSDGRLGHPEAEGHRYFFRSDIPRKVEGLVCEGKRHALVSCSYYHTAAVIS